jgi:hypothetical protein
VNNRSIKFGIAFGIIILLFGLLVNPIIGMSNNDDTTPPVTTIFFDPPNPNGENDWYVSNVTVTLNATDDISGVDITFYRIDGGEWQIYEIPFIITKDGDDILIEFYSVDNAGNVEEVQKTWIDIDKTPPFINISFIEIRGNWLTGWYIVFNIYAYDNFSDLERIEILFNNELQETITGAGPEYSWAIRFWPITNSYIKVIGYDFAGNWGFAIIYLDDLNLSSHSRANLVYNNFRSIYFNWLFDRVLFLGEFIRKINQLI